MLGAVRRSHVAGVAMIAPHFQQPRVAICPVDRGDECPHDRTLPFDQRRPSCPGIRFGLTAFRDKNRFVKCPNGFVETWRRPDNPARRSGGRSHALFRLRAAEVRV
jgi:hypothetical protein